MPIAKLQNELSLEEGLHREERMLRRALAESKGQFFLYPVESNFSVEVREQLLVQLEAFLEDIGMHLHRIVLTREQYDLYAILKEREKFSCYDTVLILGLEDTPGIAPAGGEELKRPPALSVLNLQRESIERLLNVPTILWCSPFAYTALIKHAPDFYDHYAATFHFNLPINTGIGIGFEGSTAANRTAEILTEPNIMGSQALVNFYEKQLLKDKITPVEQGRALVGLAEELWMIPNGDISIQINYGLKCIDDAISLFKSSDEEIEIARALSVKGVLLRRLPSGDRYINISRAIECFESALRIYTEDNYPMKWAIAQNNLGNAYRSLPSGDRYVNISRAIECFEFALRIYTEDNYPAQWATVRNNLGIAYYDLPSGDRDSNFRRAIECFESILSIRTEDRFPLDWAATQNNLGTAYCDLPSGDRDNNLRRAIECFESALRIYTEDSYPIQWAMTQNNLGTAYYDLPSGDRDSNLRRAIRYFELALSIRTEDRFPLDWAATQNNLGKAYCDLPSGDRDNNLRRAIECFESALRIYTEDNYPMQWAMTQWCWGYAECRHNYAHEGLKRLIIARDKLKNISHEFYVNWIDSVIAYWQAQLQKFDYSDLGRYSVKR